MGGTDQRRLIRGIGSGSGHLAQKSRLTWFGLGACDPVQSARTRWPIADGEEIRDPPRPGLIPLGRGEKPIRVSGASPATPRASELPGVPGTVAGRGTPLRGLGPRPILICRPSAGRESCCGLHHSGTAQPWSISGNLVSSLPPRACAILGILGYVWAPRRRGRCDLHRTGPTTSIPREVWSMTLDWSLWPRWRAALEAGVPSLPEARQPIARRNTTGFRRGHCG